MVYFILPFLHWQLSTVKFLSQYQELKSNESKNEREEKKELKNKKKQKKELNDNAS